MMIQMMIQIIDQVGYIYEKIKAMEQLNINTDLK